MAPNARLAPDSARVVAHLDSFANSSLTEGIGPWINTTDYSTPIYTVPANQPTKRVYLDNYDPSLSQALAAVPVPSNARPAAGSDAQMTIYQPATDTLWEMWAMTDRARAVARSLGRAHPARLLGPRLLPQRGRPRRKDY